MPRPLLLATSWHRSAVADQFRALARVLHEGGMEVHWLDDRRHVDTVAPVPFIAQLHHWPGTGRPGAAGVRFAHNLIHTVGPGTVIANFAAVTPLGLAARAARVERRICWYHTVTEAAVPGCSRSRRARQSAAIRGRRLVYRSYTDVVAVSSAAAEDFRCVFDRSGRGGPSVHSRHNAVADGAHRSGPATDGGPIGAVGRLEPWKGFDVLVRAVAALEPARRLVLMGDGSERARLARLADEIGVDLDLPGTVPMGEVRARMADLSVLVVPSRAEAFGLVAAEGLAAGVPVVASDVGGLREVVRPGVTGLLVAPDDPAALARALGQALDPGTNEAWGRAARRDFQSRFDVEVWATDLGARILEGRPLGW